ncbi:MAG: nicotinate-nucleotide adenylyltransferase [Chloroflexi bacterium]|nr:nicotinate-nucleotide adenylyltransferase [Chloroflexota bacterium]
MRLGIFGGTFDPPHFGHLALASATREQLKLDKVLWVVAGQSPLKQDRQLSPEEIRVEMVQAAIADNPAFTLSRVDLDRPGPHYTVETLEILSRQFPGAELYFLMGEDSLRDLPKWRRPGGLIRLALLAVLGRPGAEADLDDLEGSIPGVAARIVWVESPRLAIASSDIQQRVREGQSVEEMVPGEVRAIIEREQLYKQ